jgi:hypothetical protein
MINTYRPSYVSAQKIEKPNVARQVVKAMKEGDNPVRFLRKGEDNKWYEGKRYDVYIYLKCIRCSLHLT